MAKIRHIAYRATDVDAMAKFFVDAMGMKMIQKRKNNAIDLSDGSVNITVLPLRAGTADGADLPAHLFQHPPQRLLVGLDLGPQPDECLAHVHERRVLYQRIEHLDCRDGAREVVIEVGRQCIRHASPARPVR